MKRTGLRKFLSLQHDISISAQRKRRGFPRPFYVPFLAAHIHIAAAAVVVIVWHKTASAVVCAAMDPDDNDSDDDDDPESLVIIAENAILVCAAHIIARVVAATVIIAIHHSKYLRLKIKFTLHTIRKMDFCYRKSICNMPMPSGRPDTEHFAPS